MIVFQGPHSKASTKKFLGEDFFFKNKLLGTKRSSYFYFHPPARRSPRGTGVRSRSPRRASDWQVSRGDPGRRDGGDIRAVRRAAGILPNSPRSGSKLCQRDSSSGARDVKGIPDCTLIPSGLHPDSSQTESDTECTTWEQTPISRRPSLTKWCVN